MGFRTKRNVGVAKISAFSTLTLIKFKYCLTQKNVDAVQQCQILHQNLICYAAKKQAHPSH